MEKIQREILTRARSWRILGGVRWHRRRVPAPEGIPAFKEEETMRVRLVLGPLATALATLALVLVVSGGTVEATDYTTTVNLDAAQAESANPGATGTGTGTVTFNSITKLLSWNISWSGTQQPVNLAHFHGPAGPGVPAGVQVTIPDITSPSTGSAVITQAQADMLMSDLMYVNFHTNHSPAGEIRGQVVMSGVGGVTDFPDGPFGSDGGSGGAAGFMAILAGIAVIVGLGTAATLAYARKR
jgi:hypothetical protein